VNDTHCNEFLETYAGAIILGDEISLPTMGGIIMVDETSFPIIKKKRWEGCLS